MTFQVLPVSGWVGNAIRVSCLELGHVEGMGNKDDSRTQCRINQWSIPLCQPLSLCVIREQHITTRCCLVLSEHVRRREVQWDDMGWELLVSSLKPVALKSVPC